MSPRDAAPAALPDGDLVARALGGDGDAYAELVRRHQDALYRYLRGMGTDYDTGLDLVQDAFVRAYDRLEGCREASRFRAWLFGIARNLFLDHRKNVRQRVVPFSAVESVHAIADPTAAQPDRELTLRAALQSLPLPLRDAFLLKHQAGYSYDEIAELTGASVSAAKMRVHRAREALREFLVEQGVHA